MLFEKVSFVLLSFNALLSRRRTDDDALLVVEELAQVPQRLKPMTSNIKDLISHFSRISLLINRIYPPSSHV